MGFLGLIPATDLAASYNVRTRQLTLFAKGEARDFTYGFTFDRVPSLGGLKFELLGWTGPLKDPASYSPYVHEQAFAIQLPSPVFPSDSVLIVDENHREGVAVDIRYTGGLPPATADQDTGAAGAASPSPTPATALDEHVTVMLGENFNIKASTSTPPFGAVTIKFDTTVLELLHSRIENLNIVWTLRPLRSGTTQVVVTTHFTIEPVQFSTFYDVKVIEYSEVMQTANT
ncbi:hypothetical protein E5K00_01565 [Hymenobacter aquaticus]|uniref:Uncharacterized protein n=1 Tax=Hymenobacter aquaticus TaxID=1867101 RepID=A0A4Z0Q1S4_9BACT|nr:hypothetical protein [Hymenobacter aquaticus]TGE23930.1 hypothetical protein E5K00_01565 [Hymenobacter aquaticus]